MWDDKDAFIEACKSWNMNNPDWYGCGRKVKFKTEESATTIANKYNQHVYHCNNCGLFHLATKKLKGN